MRYSCVPSLFLVCLFCVSFGVNGCGGGSSTPPPVFVIVSPSASQSIDQGQSVGFTASVQNDSSRKSVNWALTCSTPPCGNLSSQSGASTMYTAPASVATNLLVKVTATSNTDATKSASTTINVSPPPSITSKSLPDANGGTPYSAVLVAAGGVAPLTWTVTQGTLPPGLSLGGDGVLSGTPTQGGLFKFSVRAADSSPSPLSASADLSINTVVLPLSIGTQSLPNAVLDAAYKQRVQASGGIPPYTWTISAGSLPSWATLDATLANIYGIPGALSTSNFTVQVHDSETPPLTQTQPLAISVVTAASANDAELTGRYAFLFTGFDDASGNPIAIAGSFAADGNGKITAGVQDQNGPSTANLSVPLSGTYNIGADNRGAFTLTTASASKTFAVTVASVTNGVAQTLRFAEFDDTTGQNGQRGSGVLRLQDTGAFAAGKITGSYGFALTGQDKTGAREALIGVFTANGSGAIPSGTADQNLAGTTTTPALTGTYATPSTSTGRTAVTLNLSSGTILNLSAYIVTSTESLALSTDSFSSDALLTGTLLSQVTSGFDQSSLKAPCVYYTSGVNSAATGQTAVEIGLLTPDGSGTLPATSDKQIGPSISLDQSFTATYSVLGQGRVTITNWNGDPASPQRILYLLDRNRGFLMDTGPGVGVGFVESQSGAPAAGFSTDSLVGTFSAATLGPSAAAAANGAGLTQVDGAGGFSQTADLSTNAGLFVGQVTTGTYSVSSNGRGTVTLLKVSNASVGGISVFLLFTAFSIASSLRRRKPPRRGIAVFGLAIAIATMPNACGLHFTNEFVFYMTSPKTAVIIQASSFSATPAITFVGQ